MFLKGQLNNSKRKGKGKRKGLKVSLIEDKSSSDYCLFLAVSLLV